MMIESVRSNYILKIYLVQLTFVIIILILKKSITDKLNFDKIVKPRFVLNINIHYGEKFN